MTQLQLSLLGSFELTLNNERITKITSPKIHALLAYLAMERERAHARETLAEMLWPERPPGTASQNLRKSLSRLNEALPDQPLSPPFLLITRQSVQINPESDFWLDAATFLDTLDFVQEHSHRHLERCRRCCGRIEKILSLYRGDFLLDVNCDSPAFDAWALLKREWLRREALWMFSNLAEHYFWLADYHNAYQVAWREVEIEPWREQAHRQVMRSLALLGRRAEALAAYERLRTILSGDLEVEPAEESRALFEQIRFGNISAPAVQAIERPSPNLPVQHTPFVGRVKELTRISEYLDHPNCHLLTLTGLGGVGKTRLAQKVAGEKADEYRDGICFVLLSPLSSSRYLESALLSALEVPLSPAQQGKQAAKDLLVAVLKKKEMLLVLDNYEHLLPDTDLIIDLLERAPKITLLVTSRQPLDLHAEWIVDVLGLPYPPEGEAADIERYGSIHLFNQSSARVRGDLPLADGNAAQVAQICRMLAGVPLAIELASTWVRTMAIDEIAQQIQQDMDFLATGQRDIDPRHRSLRAVFEHSWSLLPEAERKIFSGLSVFQGEFSSAAAVEILGAEGQLLAVLADKSLLRRASEDRYELHRVLWQFAAEKLAKDLGMERQAHLAHCLYYTDFIAAREHLFDGPRIREALAELKPETENIRAAWTWALDQRLVKPIARALRGFCRYHELRSWFLEIERELNRAAEVLVELGASEDPQGAAGQVKDISILLGKVWGWQGVFSGRLGLPDDAGKLLLAKGLALLKFFGVQAESAEFLRWLAVFESQAGDFGKTEKHLRDSLEIAQEVGDGWLIAESQYELAFTAYLQANHDMGKEYCQKSLAFYRRRDDLAGAGKVLSALGLIATSQSDFMRAEEYLQESLKYFQDFGDKYRAGGVINNLGLLYFRTGAYHKAESCFEECHATFQEFHEPYGVALSLYNWGRVAHRQGEYDQARELHEAALSIRQEMGNSYLMGISHFYLGKAQLAQGNLNDAEVNFVSALEASQDSDNIYLRLQMLLGLAEIAGKKNDVKRALKLVNFALDHPESRKHIGDFPVEEEGSALLKTLMPALSAEEVETLRSKAEVETLDSLINECLRGRQGT
jgi:predicted ATPase/DNA-binding SARP family transcriptional activator